jgi:hypothetical protein
MAHSECVGWSEFLSVSDKKAFKAECSLHEREEKHSSSADFHDLFLLKMINNIRDEFSSLSSRRHQQQQPHAE